MKSTAAIFFSGILLAATHANALEITNLDKVPHTIEFEGSGSKLVRTIEPDRTETIFGQPNGRLTLVTAKNPSSGKGVIQSDGLLSGIIGNGRSAGIPAEDKDSFVIWPGGEMGIQQRRRGGKTGR